MRYLDKFDITMILCLVVIFTSELAFNTIFNITVFYTIHIIIISFGYGAYITIRIFTIVQEKNAIKKGLHKELKEINKIGDRK